MGQRHSSCAHRVTPRPRRNPLGGLPFDNHRRCPNPIPAQPAGDRLCMRAYSRFQYPKILYIAFEGILFPIRNRLSIRIDLAKIFAPGKTRHFDTPIPETVPQHRVCRSRKIPECVKPGGVESALCHNAHTPDSVDR